jgi:hypothetical protein
VNINKYLLIITAVLLIFIPVKSVFAHRMVIEELEAGLVRVGYEDGRFSRRTEIVVYNEQGMELQRGIIDPEGQFSYQPEEAALIVADDGLGHRAELVLGAEVTEEKSRSLTVGLVFTAFLALSGIFQYRVYSRKRKDGKD